GVQPFVTRGETDDLFVDVAGGVDVLSGDGTVLRLFYDGHFGDDTEIHTAGIKASIKF
ncbi:MAG: autotransporter outer membrane beta-barrel domain-containing protein, partial [bacterium]|nr:autotransporter outer membrane beta-barrel domain-containing protein [bacterium]